MGAFSETNPSTLCAESVKASLKESGISTSDIDSIYVGNAIQAGVGQNLPKQIAIAAGLPPTIPATSVNKVCASSIKALTIAATEIIAGFSKVCIVAGVESMSLAPHLLKQSRLGKKYGDFSAIDSVNFDGLQDSFSQNAMGVLVEGLNAKKGITREESDRFAIQSFQRCIAAWEKGLHQCVPIEVKPGSIIDKDENLARFNPSKIPTLRPSFANPGTITPANASGLADGAASVIIADETFVKKHNLNAVARIVSYSDAGVDPSEFPLGSILATRKCLEKAGKSDDDIDLWEINEAFASVGLLFASELGIYESKINVLGGACAIGHPLGCSGVRIVVTLISALKSVGKKYGLAAICNGGGGGTAVLIELLN